MTSRSDWGGSFFHQIHPYYSISYKTIQILHTFARLNLSQTNIICLWQNTQGNKQQTPITRHDIKAFALVLVLKSGKFKIQNEQKLNAHAVCVG